MRYSPPEDAKKLIDIDYIVVSVLKLSRKSTVSKTSTKKTFIFE